MCKVINAESLITRGFVEVSEEFVRVEVCGDVNDGDYINESTEIDTLDLLDTIINVSDKVMNTLGGDWRNASDSLTEDEYETFSDILPRLDIEEVHTIESVVITAYVNGKYLEMSI